MDRESSALSKDELCLVELSYAEAGLERRTANC